MRPAWRLATNNLSSRPGRTLLLIGSVAMCAALIAAVACALASVTLAVERRIGDTVGAADARLRRTGSADPTMDAALLPRLDSAPGVRLAVGRLERIAEVRNERTGLAQRLTLHGVMPDREFGIRPLRIIAGQTLALKPVASDPPAIVIEQNLADKLSLKPGDDLAVLTSASGGESGSPGTHRETLRVAGVVEQPGLSIIFDRFQAYVSIADLWRITGKAGVVSEIDVLVNKDINAEQWVKSAAASFGDHPEVKFEVSAKVAAGFQQNVRGNEIVFVLASVLAFVAAAFIIATGLTTNVTERIRELAVIRCVGGSKGQLAGSQLLVGVIIGFIGGVIGVPAGSLGAAALVAIFRDQLPAGFAFSWLGVVLGLCGSMIAGIIGGLWPAISAARISPLEGLSVRSRPVHSRWIIIALTAGLLLLVSHAAVIMFAGNTDAGFWTYVFVAVPCMMSGYFLLSVPITWAASEMLSPLISRVLGLPRPMLKGTLHATPFRHGFTAGAMMLGLALMVSIWTNGRSVLSDWLEKMEVPDAFAVGLFPYPEKTLERIGQVPGIQAATPISMLTVNLPDKYAQGISAVNKLQSSYIGFEPDTFFRLTALKWEMPADPGAIEQAKARIAGTAKGATGLPAILVAREFLVNRGLTVGDVLNLRVGERSQDFEIVGVVRSPGLDIVAKFFNVGEGMADQSVNAVFGSRANLKAHFNYSSWSLIQMGLTDAVKNAPAIGAPAGTRNVEAVLKDVRAILGMGILEVGSAVEIKARINEAISAIMLVMSVVAIGAMFVACLAVANLIIAGIQTRQFEFGVLRAVGAQRWLLGRLVIGEALVVGLAACVLGTCMGMQAGWGGKKLYEVILGIELNFRPPLQAILIGSAAVVAVTMIATFPAAMRLTARPPRELIGAMKG